MVGSQYVFPDLGFALFEGRDSKLKGEMGAKFRILSTVKFRYQAPPLSNKPPPLLGKES